MRHKVPYRYDGSMDLEDNTLQGESTTPSKVFDHKAPRSSAPLDTVDYGELFSYERSSYSYEYSYDNRANVVLVEVALVESSLMLDNVSEEKLGATETVLFGHTIAAMLSPMNLYSSNCFVSMTNSSNRRVRVSFAVEVVVHDIAMETEVDWRTMLSEQVQATLTHALTAGELSSAFAAAAAGALVPAASSAKPTCAHALRAAARAATASCAGVSASASK